MNIFDYLRSIYKKTKIDFKGNLGDCIVISRYLSYDKNNLKELKNLIKYLFYIEPKHYYYLLYFNISKKYMPFLKAFKKNREKENEVIKKIKEYFKWNNREVKQHELILKKLKNKKEIKQFLGVK